jgi:hypothetical protein
MGTRLSCGPSRHTFGQSQIPRLSGSPKARSLLSRYVEDADTSRSMELWRDIEEGEAGKGFLGRPWAQDSVVGPPGTPSVKVKFPAFQAVPR